MGEPTADLILGLPTAISCELLCVWLCIPSLVRLDSAYCAHKNRSNLLALYQQPELLFSHSCPDDLLSWVFKRNIKICDFKVCEEVSVKVAMAYLKEHGHCLKAVKVEQGASADVIEAVAAYCPNVRVLETSQLDDGIIRFLNGQRSVKRLDYSLPQIEPERKATLQELRHLRKLGIYWQRALGNEERVCSVVRKCPELTHFSFKFGFSLVEFSVPTLFAGLTKLVALRFDSPSVDDAALSVIVDFCPLIEHLDLRGNNHLCDISLYNVATRLKLKSIAFNSTYNITDQGLLYLCQCASTLKEVHIAQTAGFRGFGTPKITLAAISTHLSCTNLTLYDWRCRIMFVSFDVSVCACATTIVVSVAATDALLNSIAEHCTQLQHLNIVLTGGVQVPQYTSAGLYVIIHTCPYLRTIRVNKHIKQQAEFVEILNLYKHLFVYSTSNAEFLYDVMDM